MARTLSPIRPSAAIEARYEARCVALLDKMQASIVETMSAAYEVPVPEVTLYALDKSPTQIIQAAMNRLAKQWLKRFDTLADNLAAWFAQAVQDRCDNTLKSQLRDAGFTVRFRMTPAMRAAAESTVNENVSLIRSIGEQHLGQVEQLVMRSVSEGRDLGYLTEQLTKRYGITRRRAANIARGQNNAATTAMRRVRELELGLEEGEWLHSGGGKEPRPPHVAFSRKRFKLAEGHDFKDGNGKVMPGQLPGCRCTWGAVIPGFDD